MEMNNDIRRVIIAGGSDIEIRKIALETGMISLRRAGLLNCLRGVTSIEDVIAQTVGDETAAEEALKKDKAKNDADPTSTTVQAIPA